MADCEIFSYEDPAIDILLGLDYAQLKERLSDLPGRDCELIWEGPLNDRLMRDHDANEVSRKLLKSNRFAYCSHLTLGRKVRLFFAKKKFGFFVQWSFPKRVLYFLTQSYLRKKYSFYKLQFHKMSKLSDCQI